VSAPVLLIHGTADRTVQQISNRRVLFVNGSLDISDALIAFMNAAEPKS
jgi:hypothetical protein